MPIMTKEKFDDLFAKATPAQDPAELWWLIEKLNQHQPTNILEIGGGATSFFWGFFAPTTSLTLGHYSGAKSGIPHESEPFDGFVEYFGYDTNPSYHGARTFICDSHLETTKARVAEFGPFDFMFIDGDHRRWGVQMDIEMYFPLVKPGGLIAFHDWFHQGTYAPDGDCRPVHLAFQNLGMTAADEICGSLIGYGICTVQL